MAPSILPVAAPRSTARRRPQAIRYFQCSWEREPRADPVADQRHAKATKRRQARTLDVLRRLSAREVLTFVVRASDGLHLHRGRTLAVLRRLTG